MMTTEKAIQLLQRISDSQFDGIHGDERREALEMAVRALSSQQTDTDSQGLVNDCISRQAAIIVFENSGLDDDSKDTAVRVLEQLPSAQPHWIPCSERLPEEDVYVLICYKYKEGEGDSSHVYIDMTSYGQAYFGGRKCSFKEWRSPFEYFHANYEVVAWMPFPSRMEVRAMFRKVFSSDEVADIVMKVVGEIEPVGETHTDDARFNHLILLLNTLDILIDEVRFILPNIDRHEFSMNRAGQLANKWIKDKHELFGNDIGGESE